MILARYTRFPGSRLPVGDSLQPGSSPDGMSAGPDLATPQCRRDLARSVAVSPVWPVSLPSTTLLPRSARLCGAVSRLLSLVTGLALGVSGVVSRRGNRLEAAQHKAIGLAGNRFCPRLAIRRGRPRRASPTHSGPSYEPLSGRVEL